MIEVSCPSCHRVLKAKPELIGKRVKCPGCQSPLTLSPPASGLDSETLSDLGLDAPAPPPPSQPKPNPLFDGAGEDDPFANAPEPSANVPTYSAPTPRVQPSRAALDLPDSRTYPALQIVRIMLLVIAGFTAIGWLLLLVVGMLGMFAGGSQEDLGTGAVAAGGFSLIYFFTTFVGTAITCCMLVAGAELIKVVLDIQSNTLIAAKRA